MNRPEEIIIVGAGLVGSLLAVKLGSLGYKVVVYEKRDDMRSQEVDSGRSINLALAERGIHALDQAGLMDEVRKLLIPMNGRMLHDVNGELEFFPYGQRPDEVIYSVSRGGLNELMMSAAESSKNVEIRFQYELNAINFQKQEIQFTNLQTHREETKNYQILIGADGAGSRVRRAMLPAVGGDDRSELLDHDYKELTIPSNASGRHRIEKEALHIWPRGGY
ncbi:MAG: NAD(P)/FAD-dependent oxidoreductase, partial [Planctomycetota bacterium]